MMLSEVVIQREIDNGMSAVCAWCEHHWATLKDGATPGCQQADCGGPMRGKAFPRYKGPRPNLASYCFICGKDADMSVEFHGGGHVGCCSTNEGQLRKMMSRFGKSVVVRERIVPVVQAAPTPG